MIVHTDYVNFDVVVEWEYFSTERSGTIRLYDGVQMIEVCTEQLG